MNKKKKRAFSLSPGFGPETPAREASNVVTAPR